MSFYIVLYKFFILLFNLDIGLKLVLSSINRYMMIGFLWLDDNEIIG